MSFIKNLFSGGGAASAPSPTKVASAQGAANEKTARLQAKLNRADTYTPYGSVTYEDMGDDRWKVSQTLSPEQQGLLDSSQGIGQTVLDAAQSRADQVTADPFSLEGVGDFQTEIDRSGLMGMPTADSLDAYATRAESAAYDKVAGRLRDEQSRQREALETKLANQGITMGSDAYGTAVSDFDQNWNDAYTQAGYDAVSQGAALRSSLLADALTGRQQGLSERMTDLNLANQGRAQGINDMLLERSQPLNEMAALLQGAPAIQGPAQQPMSQVGVAPPDVTGAYSLAAAADQNAAAQRRSTQNAGLGGLFTLGAAALA